MEKKKGNINKILILVLIIVLIMVLVIGFLFLTSSKKVPITINNKTNNQTAEENNNTIPPATTEVNVSFNKSLKLSIKASNPQYKSGQDITIQYTIENTKNETLDIPSDVFNGIKVKNPGGKILKYNGPNGGIKVITESLTIGSLKKVSGSFIIKGNDYDFFTIGNNADGYFNTISAYIGDVESNRIIPRFLKY